MNKMHTVLVVDDQPENLAILGELLEADYHVKVANSGQRALRAAVTEPRPDLILLDVMMPEMDGYQTLARLREDPLTRHIPVVFVTAKDQAADEERGLELGAADYITKPIKPIVVLARVHTQLENKRAKDWLKDQNAFLESEIRRRMHDNELIQNASLHALATLAETRDADTGSHIFRTQAYVEQLAQAIRGITGLRDQTTDEQLKMIVRAAPLHDIGKVGIPDQILRKPGLFTKEEFDVMKTHCQIGSDAIALAMQRVKDADRSTFKGQGAPLAFLEVARLIARSHHERWDGAGYPDGLRGEAIPLAARIMALADVFDALTTKRVYKDAFPVSDAVATITAEKGKHFDPALVDVFLERRNEFAKIAYEFSDAR
ncbi:HD domain-containing phosphohydrolase [Rhodoferax sp.]|uniref:response regulator n=1 Tax=Rhodoferax sp. TaxID=50421 RepID=UPI002609E9D0|nr:HD domain-containing phosphohydrolase [Rhodoferax sp.]MDD2925236.1 response regulator [Rhodoferax sp.]